MGRFRNRGIALTSLGSLVSIFVIGREEQKSERIAKAKTRDQISRDEPIEKVEGEDASIKTSSLKDRTSSES
jgi:hypothetical protein